MNLTKKILSAGLAGIMFCSALFAQNTANAAPFTKGFNFTSWFEAWSPGIPNLQLYDKSDLEHVKELGCDIIRLPIHFDMFLEDEKTMKIKPIVFDYLDKACDWAEELGIYLVIDNHSFNSGKYPSAKKLEEHLEKVWPQVIEHFKNRSDHIIFEILNEPQVTQDEWVKIQEKILKLIRSIDTKHTVVVTGADWGSLNAMVKLNLLEDSNLIYTFHYYDPFIFTHQGANWSSKEVESLAGVPFPYDKARLPKLTGAAKGSWVESNLRSSYSREGTEDAVRKQLYKAVDFSVKNNVRVWCGEMGVYDLNSLPEDRNRWYNIVGGILNEYKIPFTVWGFDSSFGVFTKNTRMIYPYDLNVEVIKGLGMKVPAKAGNPVPDSGKLNLPFCIYEDFGGKKINISSWGCGSALADWAEDVAEGSLCYKITNADRYGSLSFSFSGIDFSGIKAVVQEASLTFKVKFTNASQSFQVRFVNTDNDAENLKPWRMSYNIKASNYPLNEWVTVSIPLKSMFETGAWCNSTQKWFNQNNEFDWSRIESLQFVAEDSEIKGEFYLDEIRIKGK